MKILKVEIFIDSIKESEFPLGIEVEHIVKNILQQTESKINGRRKFIATISDKDYRIIGQIKISDDNPLG